MNLCLESLRSKMIRETELFLQSRLQPREQKPASKPPLAASSPWRLRKLVERGRTRSAPTLGPAAVAGL